MNHGKTGGKKRIGVKFCGNCRPCIDAMEIYNALKISMEKYEVGFWTEGAKPDCLVLINSCTAACVSTPGFSGPIIAVAPDSIDSRPVNEKNLVSGLVTRIQEEHLMESSDSLERK